jgi:hypothetical protein
MDQLPKDWITQGLIDFEYKKYILLAYLKAARQSFSKVELYPFLGDLVQHYRHLLTIQESKSFLKESFPKELSLEDLNKLALRYKELVEDDGIMSEIQAIIDYALPQIKDSLEEGSAIYEYVEKQCEIAPVGVTPLYAKEGYLFVSQPPERETTIYRYQMSLYEDSNEEVRGLQTTYVEKVEKSRFMPYEVIKLLLVKKFKELPNPATFLALSRANFPESTTLMPIIKRLFMKHLSTVV